MNLLQTLSWLHDVRFLEHVGLGCDALWAAEFVYRCLHALLALQQLLKYDPIGIIEMPIACFHKPNDARLLAYLCTSLLPACPELLFCQFRIAAFC